MRILIFISTLFFCFWTGANEQAVDGVDYDVIARDRLYEGGADEEDLRVQDVLPVPEQGVTEKSLQSKYMEEILNRAQASDSQPAQ